MEISCKTCAYGLGKTVLCGKPCDSGYSGWTPNIHAVQEDLDQAFTAFTDKIKTCYAEDARKDLDMCYEKSPLSDTQKKITEICDEVKNILLEKNRKYGDSAINPKRVFSKASPIEQINVRLDDKLSRIMSAQDDDTEDAELDLIGYLILKRVAKSVGEGK